MSDPYNPIEAARAIMNPPNVGSDVSDLVDKLKAWLDNLALDGMAGAALHALYHYVADELIPDFVAKSPTKADDFLLRVIAPLLQKLHDAFFPHTES